MSVVVAASRRPQLSASTARHGHGLSGAAAAKPQPVEWPAQRALLPAAWTERRDHGSGAGPDQGVDETQHAGQRRGGGLAGEQFRAVDDLLGDPPLSGGEHGGVAERGKDCFGVQRVGSSPASSMSSGPACCASSDRSILLVTR
jgi:hypothetical protein